MKQRVLRVLSIVAMSMALGLVSCGKKKQDKIAVTIAPSSPVVFDVPWNIPDRNPDPDVDDSETIEPNWFAFKIKVTNKLDSPVTLVAIKFTARGTKNGLPVIGTSSISADADVPAIVVIPANSVDYDVTTLLIVKGLPEVDTLFYNVEAEFKGWVGTASAPEGPVTYTTKFKTAKEN